MSLLGLYLHVPFCTRRCDYCDFYVVVGRERMVQPFVARLSREIRGAGDAPGAPPGPADTVYLGGGTPSLLTGVQVRSLVDACRDTFGLARGAEITLEANPEGIGREALDGWLEAGVNRLSVGIQSTDDRVLKARGRLHSGREALESVRLARRAGFANISADLIAGLPPGSPGEPGATDTIREVTAGIRAVMETAPDHLSLYLLETDKETPLMAAARQGRLRLPSDDEAADAFIAARELLLRGGFQHYEISSFCRPGMRSRHNVKYWRSEPVLGFGPSAHSSLGGRLTSRPRDLDAFLSGSGASEDHTLPGAGEASREALVLNLRLLEGVDLGSFDARHGTAFRRELPPRLEELEEAGWIAWEGGILRLTPSGVLMANELFARIAHLPEDAPLS